VPSLLTLLEAEKGTWLVKLPAPSLPKEAFEDITRPKVSIKLLES